MGLTDFGFNLLLMVPGVMVAIGLVVLGYALGRRLTFSTPRRAEPNPGSRPLRRLQGLST